uniref:Uncharacterized protein n=1 Tax=Physcomitrium patens TaxID=3218 RepID=A0A2K1IGF2_PHYPA|nr:hypothetical protein PHYPA_028945 [Physcomitrium patens]
MNVPRGTQCGSSGHLASTCVSEACCNSTLGRRRRIPAILCYPWSPTWILTTPANFTSISPRNSSASRTDSTRIGIVGCHPASRFTGSGSINMVASFINLGRVYFLT